MISDPNVRGVGGTTGDPIEDLILIQSALMCAVTKMNFPIVKLLLEKGKLRKDLIVKVLILI